MPLGPTELLIIAGVLVLLFGATKLPKLARSMGESARIFKSETKGIREDDKAEAHSEDSAEARESEPAGSETSTQPRQLPASAQQAPVTAETVEQTRDRHEKAS